MRILCSETKYTDLLELPAVLRSIFYKYITIENPGDKINQPVIPETHLVMVDHPYPVLFTSYQCHLTNFAIPFHINL